MAAEQPPGPPPQRCYPIGGVRVMLPVKPYPCQLAMMAKVGWPALSSCFVQACIAYLDVCVAVFFLLFIYLFNYFFFLFLLGVQPLIIWFEKTNVIMMYWYVAFPNFLTRFLFSSLVMKNIDLFHYLYIFSIVIFFLSLFFLQR